MNTPMMKCGHAANAIDMATNKPCCAICVGLGSGYNEVDENYKDQLGRKAKCATCGTERDSSTELPFFESKPAQKYDFYYCGCMGWE